MFKQTLYVNKSSKNNLNNKIFSISMLEDYLMTPLTIICKYYIDWVKLKEHKTYLNK